MAKGTPIKTKRNKKLVEMKKKMTFKNIAKMFNISETRAKQIYYKETKGASGIRDKKDNTLDKQKNKV